MGKWRVIFFVGLVFWSASAFGQSERFSRDSLNYMKIMNEGMTMATRDSALAMDILKEAKAFADSVGNPHFHLKNQRLYIFYLENWGYLNEADSLFEVLIHDAKQQGDQQNLYVAFAGKGVLLYRQGLYGQALEYYYNAIEIAEARKDTVNLSRMYNNLSLVQKKLEDFDASLATLQKAAALKEAKKDTSGLASLFINQGNLLRSLEQNDAALAKYQEAAELYRLMGDTVNAQLVGTNLGELYYHNDQYDLAAAYFDSSLVVMGQLGPSIDYLLTLAYRADVFNYQNEPDKALTYYDQIQEILGDQQYAPLEKEIYKGQSEAYSKKGDYQKAYEIALKLREVERSLVEANETELQEKYETLFQVKEQESRLKISELKLENEQGKSRLWTIIGAAAIVFFLLAGVIAIVNKRRNLALAEKNAVVTKSLKEREVLLREIHHRVKNNLQIVSSMLSMQSRRVQDEDARSGMLDSQFRVESMSLIHEHLYLDEHLAHVAMKDYVDKLIRNLRQSFEHENLTIQQEVEVMQLDIDTAVPLGLILNEAVTNSLKHAFASAESGVITVSLKRENQRLVLRVADNGQGFNPEEQNKSSFGMTMMRAFAESLEGELSISSDQGSILEFSLPLKE